MDTLKLKRKKASSECGFVWTIQGFRIAVVDDRFDWRLRIKREVALLVGDKILIDEYESGEKFLKEDQIYDLILLDVEMKGKDGFETAAIVSMPEVVEHLYNKEYNGEIIIDDTLKTAIDAYYEQYGVK